MDGSGFVAVSVGSVAILIRFLWPWDSNTVVNGYHGTATFLRGYCGTTAEMLSKF